MSVVNLLLFDLEKLGPLARDLHDYYGNNSGFEVASLNNVSEAITFLNTSGNGVVLLKIHNKEDLTNVVSILKGLSAYIKKGLVKPACFLFIQNKKVERLLFKYGCTDILETSIKSRALAFKIDIWTKNVRKQIEIIEKLQEQKAKKSAAAASKNEDTKSGKKREEMVEIEPLKLSSDIWLIQSKSDCKKILRRWLVRVLGPSPSVGKWMELEARAGDDFPTWRFVLNKEGESFVIDDGAWFFYGPRPEFDWKTNRWNFTGENLHLYFYTQEQEVFSRMKFEDGQLQVAKNSRYALAMEQAILDTCDKKYEFSQDEDEATEAAVEGEEEEELGGHLEGKTKGEQALGGNLKGKVDNSADDESENDESSRFEDEADHLDPYKSNSSYKEEPIGQNKKRTQFEEDPLGGHYDGKSSTDDLGGGPLSGKLKGQDELDEKNKKREGYQEDDLGGNLSGKSSTDEIDRGPLGGKVRRQNDEDSEDQKNHFQEEEIEGFYGGKGKTDHQQNDPLKGKIGEGQNPFDKKKKKSEFQEDPIDGHYDGKGKTEHKQSDPLKGKVGSTENPLDRNNKSQFQEDAIDGHYDGDTTTDHMDGGPLRGKMKKSTSSGEKNKKGTFHEDATDDNYDGEVETDKLEHSPLSGKLNPSSTDNDDENDFENGTDKLAGHIGGKGATSKLDNKNLSGKIDNRKHDQDDLDDDEDLDGRLDHSKRKNNKNVNPNIDDDSDIEGENSTSGLGPRNTKAKSSKEGQSAKGHLDSSIIDTQAESHNSLPAADRNKKGIDKNKHQLDLEKGASLFGGKKKRSIGGKPVDSLEPTESLLDQGAKNGNEFSGPSTIGDKKIKLREKLDKESLEDENVSALNKAREAKKKGQQKVDEKAAEMDELLGGGLTKGSKGEVNQKKEDLLNSVIGEEMPVDQVEKVDASQIQIGKAVENNEEELDINTIVGGEVEVSLESGEVKVILQQETGKGNDITFICRFEDMYENEMIVHAPKHSLMKDSAIKVSLSMSYNDKKVVIKSKGIIAEIEENDEKTDTLILSLDNIDAKRIEQFMDLYQQRQESIHDFMELAKGY